MFSVLSPLPNILLFLLRMEWLIYLLLIQCLNATSLKTKKPMFALIRPKAAAQVESDNEGRPIVDADPGLAHIKFKMCKSPSLPQIFGSNIYALVRPKLKPQTSEERASVAFQENALQRLVRCRLNNSLCFRVDPPKPRIEFGKFSWTAQRFEPLKAGISAVACKMPIRASDDDVHAFWNGVLNANGTNTELKITVANYFLSEASNTLSSPAPISWNDILMTPTGSIQGLFMMMQKGPDPLDPAHPLNPLFPYSPLNPFFNADKSSQMSPFNEESSFYPSNPKSPFSVLNPGNPFNVFSPILLLPPSDPMSPFNPSSPYFPTSPLSPYNSENQNSPLSTSSLLPMPAPSSPFSPFNDGFMLHPLNAYYPTGDLASLAVLSENHPNSPMNPVSPFYPITAWNPSSPLDGLLLTSTLNPLNLEAHPFNLINGEEVPRSLTEAAPILVHFDVPGLPGSMPGRYGSPNLEESAIGTSSSPQAFHPLTGPFMADGPHPPNRPSFVRTVGRWFYRSKPVAPTITAVNPCDPRSPFFAGHEYSPFYPFHPSNPYSIMNPLNALPPSDPRSPYNPASAVFAGNPESPYNPQHPMNPFNPQSFLWTCQQSGSLHPMNPRSPFYPLNPRSPFSPLNSASPYNSNHPLLTGLDPTHALNPALKVSPFHASNPASPYNPENFNKLNPSYPLNSLHSEFTSVTSTQDPTVSMGWNKGVKEDWSFVSDPRVKESKAQADEQLIPFKAPEAAAQDCGPAPPAPEPPKAPYYPGYYMWDPSWPAPKYIRTSEVPVNDPIDPKNWLQIWHKLWELKCKRQAALKLPPQPYGPDYAIMDLPAKPAL